MKPSVTYTRSSTSGYIAKTSDGYFAIVRKDGSGWIATEAVENLKELPNGETVIAGYSGLKHVEWFTGKTRHLAVLNALMPHWIKF